MSYRVCLECTEEALPDGKHCREHDPADLDWREMITDAAMPLAFQTGGDPYGTHEIEAWIAGGLKVNWNACLLCPADGSPCTCRCHFAESDVDRGAFDGAPGHG